MNVSLKTHTGRSGMPAVVLVHGLGMNNYFWDDPEKCFVLGGLAPLTIFLSNEKAKIDNTISFGGVDPDLEGLWSYLKTAGYSLASWTQSQPLGPLQIAVDELKTNIDSISTEWPDKAIYLIGHSRGGLIARKFLSTAESSTDISGLVTICSPHSGTRIAKFAGYLKPAGKILEKILPDKSRAAVTKALSRLADFLQSPAIAELEPESEFMASLQKKLPEQMAKLSFGGTNPVLFHVIVRLPGGRKKVIRFPELLAGAIPAGHMPQEIKPGLGDGLVEAGSARLPGSKHFDFSVNHVRAAYDKNIHELIRKFLQH